MGPLAPFRDAVRQAVEGDLGWRAWLYDRDAPSGPKQIEILEPAIRRAHAVVWIAGARYGTEFAAEPISYTEWEVLKAIEVGTRVVPYVIGSVRADPRSADPKQLTLVRVFGDAPFSFLAHAVNTPEELRLRVVHDLQELGRRPYRNQRTFDRSVSQTATSAPLSVSEAERMVAQCLELRRLERYHEALDLGYQLVETYFGPLAARGRLADLDLCRDFVRTFYELLALAGIFKGRISAISMALAWFEIELLRGDVGAAAGAAQCASGVLAGGGEVDRGHEFIQWSAFHAGDEEMRGSAFDGRAHIMWRLGDEEEAIRCLRLAEPRLPDPFVKAYVKSSLGAKLVSVGGRSRRAEAERLFIEADATAGHGLTRVVFLLNALPYITKVDGTSRATSELDRGLALCDHLGLAQPKIELAGLGKSLGL